MRSVHQRIQHVTIATEPLAGLVKGNLYKIPYYVSINIRSLNVSQIESIVSSCVLQYIEGGHLAFYMGAVTAITANQRLPPAHALR